MNKMRLWLLEPLPEEKLPKDRGNPWKPWYDKSFSFVVRAETERKARKLADGAGGYENNELECAPRPWLRPEYSTCEELLPYDGEAGVIIRNYAVA